VVHGKIGSIIRLGREPNRRAPGRTDQPDLREALISAAGFASRWGNGG
jgi:hypothetical protein